MCTNTGEMRKASYFDYRSVTRYLEEEIKKNKIMSLETIGLTGGETTIAPYFFKIMDYISQRHPGIRINLLTNGRTFVYDDFLQKCLEFQKMTFIIPLHGYDAKSHDRITQAPGSFEQTTRGLKKLLAERRTGQEVEIRIVANRGNLQIIPQILKLIKEELFKIDRIVLIFLEFEGVSELNKDKVGITYKEIQPVLLQIKEYFKVFKDLRLYHFPLCVLEPFFWPFAWRTLPKEEVTYLALCRKCSLKKYCLGIHKSYLSYVEKPEIRPWPSLKGIKIKESDHFHKPIAHIKR